MGYVVREENSQTGDVTRRGPFVTEQEARMVLANAVEQAYDFNPQLATAGNRGTDPCDTVGVIRLMEIGVARGCD